MANITDIERLNYYEGEFLGATDFQTEQEYHRDMRRRHNIGQHTWGIVSGLDIAQVPVPGTTTNAVDVYIQPGMAVDGFGREIVVLNKTQLTLDLFAVYPNAGLLTVWISYAQVQLNPPTDPCTAGNQPDAFGRVQEAFAISFPLPDGTPPSNNQIVVDGTSMTVPVQPTPPPPPVPPPVPGVIVLPYDDSVPYQEFPADDSTAIWYVQLGQVFWDPVNKELVQIPDAAAGRQYVGSVASAIFTPDNSLMIQDRFAPFPLPKDLSDPTLKKFYGGVGVEIAGSLSVDRLLEAKQNILIDGAQDAANQNLSPLTVNPRSGDQSLVQFRDSSGVPLWSIWETPAGLNFGEADSTSGSPKPPSALIVQKGGNVGIGANLTVNGTLNIDPANTNTGSLSPGLTFGSAVGGGATGEGIASNRKSAVNQFGLDFYTAGKPQLSITSVGNVGIGTASPSHQLEVVDAGSTGLRVQTNAAGGTVASFGGSGDFQIDAPGVVGGRLIVKDGGKVGIGTPSPSHQLEVVDASNTGLRVQTNIAGGTVASFGGFGDFQIDAPGVFGGRLIVKDGSGNVGIGTATPSAQLEVTGSVKFQGKSLVQIYRLYNSTNGDHFYTPSLAEAINAVNNDGYTNETLKGDPSFFAFSTWS